MTVPFEEYLPSLIQYLKPELKKAPGGAALVREAFENKALPYEDRASLLVEGQRQMAEDQEAVRNWRIGQGLAGGAVAASAGVRGMQMLSGLANSLDSARQGSRIKLLEEAVAHGAKRKQGLMDMIARDAAAAAGIRPVKDANVRELLAGPMQAQYGNVDKAIKGLGKVIEDNLGGAGIFRSKDPLASKALRAAISPQASLWDQLSRTATKGLRGISRAGLHPLSRLGITAAALGTGAYLGAKSVRDEPLPTHSIAEADEMLRQVDRAAALRAMPSLPAPNSVNELKRKAMKLPATIAEATANAGMVESVVGGTVRNVDAAGHMKNPALGANWVTIGS